MLQDRIFIMLGMMMVVPVLMILFNVDPTTSTILTMGANLGIIFYMRKTFKGAVNGLIGHTKLKWSCLTCQGTKFDSKGTCYRCGSKSRRPL